MHPNLLQKILDRYIGSFLCLLLGAFQFRAVDRVSQPRRILLIQLSAIGDTILAVPTIRAIRKSVPQCTRGDDCLVYQSTIFGRLSLCRSTNSLSLRGSDEIATETDSIYHGIAPPQIRLCNRLRALDKVQCANRLRERCLETHRISVSRSTSTLPLYGCGRTCLRNTRSGQFSEDSEAIGVSH